MGYDLKNCNSIEIRNLTFEDYTEDACSFEGSATSASSLSNFTAKNFWVHNNTFEEGVNYWDVCKEQDKHDGDGSTDIKGLAYVTFAYNTYHNCHKTGLVGGGNSQTTACVTFHHNYYNACSSRLPLARQANMHMYNNYYYKSSGTNMSLRAGAYALIENCYFENANNPIEIQKDNTYGTGAAKVINSIFSGRSYAANGRIYEVSREAKVQNDNKFGTNFDTNSSMFYYDSAANKTNVSDMLATSEVPTVIPQVAGVQKRGADVTLAVSGNNAVAGEASESGSGSGGGTSQESGETVDMSTIYSQLLAKKSYSEDFSSYADGDKLAGFAGYSTAGVYSLPDAAHDMTNSYTQVKGGKAVQVTNVGVGDNNKKNTTTVIAFGSVASSVEGYFEMSTSEIGSKWDLIKFVSSSKQLAAVRINASKEDKLTYYTSDVNSCTTPPNSLVWAKNTTYNVYFKVDLSSGSIYVKLTDGISTYEANMAAETEEICGIQLISSSSGARLVTLDNVVICVK